MSLYILSRELSLVLYLVVFAHFLSIVSNYEAGATATIARLLSGRRGAEEVLQV